MNNNTPLFFNRFKDFKGWMVPLYKGRDKHEEHENSELREYSGRIQMLLKFHREMLSCMGLDLTLKN